VKAITRTPEMMKAIFSRLATGESLRQICQDEGMPAHSTFLDWVNADAELSDQYAHARDRQAAGYAEEIVEIADTEEDPNRARVRIDARKWVACKLLPKKYGEKIDHSVEGSLTVIIDRKPKDA
jgi:hypothetical protein